MVLITIVTGAYKPTNMTGGPRIVQKTRNALLSNSKDKTEVKKRDCDHSDLRFSEGCLLGGFSSFNRCSTGTNL